MGSRNEDEGMMRTYSLGIPQHFDGILPLSSNTLFDLFAAQAQAVAHNKYTAECHSPSSQNGA